MASEDESESAQAHRVSIKPPAFMDCAVQGWFAIMEAQFHLASIKADTSKFYHVLASLPPTTISKLDSSVLTGKDYTKLKSAVTELHERSKPELFDQLITKVQLTGRPSLYVKELQELAGKVGVGDDLVRHKLLQSLPPTVGAVLAAQKELTLHQLGKLADVLLPLLQSPCLAVPAEQQQQQFQPQLHQQQQFQPPQLQQPQHRSQAQTSAYQQGTRQQPASSSSSSLPTGLRPFHRDQRPLICRAHLYFGAQAKTCKPWCQWPQKNQVTMQPSSRKSSPERQGN